MKLTIKNFHNVEFKEYVFSPEQQITLIKGDSGTGKTTILDSIRWVLYNIGTDVINLKHPKTEMYVELDIEDVVIKRMKNPIRLSIKHNGDVYEAETAQGFIDRRWGCSELWENTVYIGGDLFHVLMTGTQKEKMKFMNDIIHGNDFSERIISKAKDIESKLLDKFKVDEQVCAKQRQLLGEPVAKPEHSSDFYHDMIGNIKLVDTLTAKLEKYKITPQEQEAVEMYKNRLPDINKLEQYSNVSPSIPVLNDDELAAAMLHDSQYVNYFSKLKEFNIKTTITQEELDTLYNLREVEELHVLKTELRVALKKEEKRNEELQQLATSLGCESILAAKEKLTRLVQTEPERAHLRSLKAECAGYTLSHVAETVREGNHRVYPCPWCVQSVRIHEAELVKTKLAPKKDVMSKIEFERYTKLHSKLLELEETKLEKDSETTLTIDQIKKYLSDIEGEQMIATKDTRDVDTLRAIIANGELLMTITSKYGLTRRVVEQIQCISKPPFTYSQYKDRLCLVDYIKIMDGIPENIKSLVNKNAVYLEVSAQLSELPELSIPALDACQVCLKQCADYDKYTKQYDVVEQVTRNLESTQKSLAVASKYCNYVITKESEFLASALDTVNRTLESICTELFDDAIMVSVDCFKEKGVRPTVNMKIVYRGHEYKSFKKLSSGEINRLTLALSVAFGRMVVFPYILYDEILNRLSEEQRINSVECIRKYLFNKNVIYVGHKDSEHVFDHIIEL